MLESMRYREREREPLEAHGVVHFFLGRKFEGREKQGE
jgi:hypothetical protein